LNCNCGNTTRVVETRSHKGTKYRKRKCSCGLIFSTKEITCDYYPYKHKDNTYKIKGEIKKKPKKRKPKENKKPKVQFKGIQVTKESPDWIKRIAEKIK
jgi:hypothetical protein